MRPSAKPPPLPTPLRSTICWPRTRASASRWATPRRCSGPRRRTNSKARSRTCSASRPRTTRPRHRRAARALPRRRDRAFCRGQRRHALLRAGPGAERSAHRRAFLGHGARDRAGPAHPAALRRHRRGALAARPGASVAVSSACRHRGAGQGRQHPAQSRRRGDARHPRSAALSRHPAQRRGAALPRRAAGELSACRRHQGWLNRDARRRHIPQEEFPPMLDPDHQSAAYRLGRLFAVLEKFRRRPAPVSTPPSATVTTAPPRPRRCRCSPRCCGSRTITSASSIPAERRRWKS